MSHGDSSHTEPNLIPLLDLVLQLIMFFMVCANFIIEQVDQTIVLPVAQQARPAGDSGADVAFLNVDAKGQLLTIDRPQPYVTDEEVQLYLTRLRDERQKRAADEAKASNRPAPTKVDTLIIIRAHRDADFKAVYRIMRKCQDLGLSRVQLRATVRL